MSFTKNNLEQIKNKILLSTEIEKKTKLTKKGQDHWCCCLFHQEKTPSMKINDDIGSYYCFGCGAKGDLFTLYTEFYNYSFQDAVKELADRANIILAESDFKVNKNLEKINKILSVTLQWYKNNLKLKESVNCKTYLEKRKLSNETIEKFDLGYSYNPRISLFDFLLKYPFSKEDIIKSNVVKIDKNNNIKDYFYKRLIFPIFNEQSKIIGFGGRSLDESNPKYLNSPESDFFKKRNILYNFSKAKPIARKKNNLLICEGYMDVISLSNKGIDSVVAPLGTSLTENQLFLAWKLCSKPTLMFDGDNSGVKAVYRSLLMSLNYINPSKSLQTIVLPNNEDPDSLINKLKFDSFLNILKKPTSIVDFLFYQAVAEKKFDTPDEKIQLDKFLDEIVNQIKDQKIKYFYKSEFKSLFFKLIRGKKIIKNNTQTTPTINLIEKHISSFIACYINHKNIRKDMINDLIKAKNKYKEFDDLIDEIIKDEYLVLNSDDFSNKFINTNFEGILKKCLNHNIYQLFPYTTVNFEDSESLKTFKESVDFLNSRLSNSTELDKSLKGFVESSTMLKWEELQKIYKERNVK